MSALRVTLSLITVWMAVSVRDAMADIRDSFESAEPTWRLAESDCGAQLTMQERTFRTSHSGSGSEFLRLSAGQGTYAYLIQDIPPGRSISELAISLWLKADRSGMQLLARVVFPRALDARTGKPIRVWIRGSQYDRVGAWQMLAIPNPSRLIQQHATILNAQLKTFVDPREAYIDLIAVNAYGGMAVTNLWIDDLEINGHVPVSEQTISPPILPVSSGRNAASGRPGNLEVGPPAIDVSVQGGVLLVGGRPFVPRIVTHRGESLTWLKSLGFNTIHLSQPPTADQLQEARQQNLWLIAPPHNLPVGYEADVNRNILAWNLGNSVTAEQTNWLRALANDRPQFRDVSPRPLLIGAARDESSLSRMADILRFDPPVANDLAVTSTESLKQRAARTRPAMPLWATVVLDPAKDISPARTELISATTTTATTTTTTPPFIDSYRLTVYQAIATGVRGFTFVSANPLDTTRPGADSLVTKCQLINRELALIEPWLSAGTGAEILDSVDPQRLVFALPSERSRLVVSVFEKYIPTPMKPTAHPKRPSVTIVDSGAFSSADAYHITPRGIVSLRTHRTGGGVKVDIATDDPVIMVLFTQDQLAIQRLNRFLAGEEK